MFPFLSDHWSHLPPFPSVSTQPLSSLSTWLPTKYIEFICFRIGDTCTSLYLYTLFLLDILRLAHARVQVLLYFSITVIIIALLVPVNEVMRKPGQWTQWTVGRWLHGDNCLVQQQENLILFLPPQTKVVRRYQHARPLWTLRFCPNFTSTYRGLTRV